MITIDREIINRISPRARYTSVLVEELNRFLPQYDITTRYRVAAFISQCCHESGGFRYLEENLNYSEEGLERVFRKYFSGAGRNAYDYARQPEKIANVVYANRMGNGDEDSGDGWYYRGRGYIQLTGRNNYDLFADYVDMNLDDAVEYAGTVAGAVESACWYWDRKGLNEYADAQDIARITYLINGGYNGLDERIDLYEKVLEILLDLGPEGVPHIGRTDIDLVYGDRGEEVEKLQRALGIRDDGIYGRDTQKAVMRFQRKHGLIADGIASKYVLAKLYLG